MLSGHGETATCEKKVLLSQSSSYKPSDNPLSPTSRDWPTHFFFFLAEVCCGYFSLSMSWKTRITCFVPDHFTSSEKRTATQSPDQPDPTCFLLTTTLAFSEQACGAPRGSISNPESSPNIVKANFIRVKRERSLGTKLELCWHRPHWWLDQEKGSTWALQLNYVR